MIWKATRYLPSGFLLLSLGTGLFAQPPALTEDFPVLVENAPDSSAGFAMLGKRILPLPESAVPVKLVIDHGNWSYNRYEIEFPTHWVVKPAAAPEAPAETSEEDAEAPIPTSTLISYTSEITGSVGMMEMDGDWDFDFDFDPEEVDYGVAELDLPAQLKKLFELLGSTDEDEKWERESALERYGHMMLFATRLHQAGYPDQANQLAAYLFEQKGKREVVLRALSILADESYMDLMRKFEQDKDPAAFVAGVKAALAKHQSVWEAAPQIEEALQVWEQSLAMAPDALPAGSEDLGDAQQLLYRKWLANPQAIMMFTEFLDGENWLLLPNSLLNEIAGYYMDEDESNTAAESLLLLQKSRKDFLKMLEVMIRDNRLLPQLNQEITTEFRYNTYNDEVEVPVPLTMQYLAMNMLYGLAPDDEDWDNDEPEDFQLSLQGFSSLTADMTRFELAAYYMERRDEYGFPEAAVYTLLSSPDAEIRKNTVNDLLTDENSMDEALSILKDFHSFHPEEAKPGLLQVHKYLKTVDPEEAWSFGGAEGLKREIASLEELLGMESDSPEPVLGFEEALDSWIATGDPDNYEARQKVISSGMSRSTDELQAILAERVNTSSFEAARMLVNLQAMLMDSGGMEELEMMMSHNGQRDMMKYYVHSEKFDEEEGEELVEEIESELTWSKAAWLPLLESTDSDDAQKKASIIANMMVMKKIRSYYDEMQMEEEENIVDIYSFRHLLSGSNNRVDQLTITWAIQLLENPEDVSWIEAIPSPDKVSEEEHENLLTLLSSDQIEEAKAALKHEDLNLRLAALLMSEYEKAVEENTELWTALLSEKNRVEVLFPIADETDPVLEGINTGSNLDMALINQILSNIHQEMQQQQKGMVVIRTNPLLQGVTLYHNREFLSEGHFRNPGTRIYGINYEERVSGDFEPDVKVQLKAPEGEAEAKEMSILDLVSGEADTQLESLGAAVHSWLTTPVSPENSYGQLTIIYSGKPENGE